MKKQKDKKNKEVSSFILIAKIFFFFMIIVSIYLLLDSINFKEEYKITQEVCHNETYCVFSAISIEVPCYDYNNNLIVNTTCKRIIEEELYEFYSEKDCEYLGGNFIYGEEVCEQKEVDEINYTLDVLERYPYIIKYWENLCITNYLMNKEECDSFPRFFNFTNKKEDLSEYFIEENCECIKCYYKKGIFDIYDSYWRTLDMEGFDKNCLEDKNGECSEYKCFDDYKIEVLR